MECKGGVSSSRDGLIGYPLPLSRMRPSWRTGTRGRANPRAARRERLRWAESAAPGRAVIGRPSSPSPFPDETVMADRCSEPANPRAARRGRLRWAESAAPGRAVIGRPSPPLHSEGLVMVDRA